MQPLPPTTPLLGRASAPPGTAPNTGRIIGGLRKLVLVDGPSRCESTRAPSRDDHALLPPPLRSPRGVITEYSQLANERAALADHLADDLDRGIPVNPREVRKISVEDQGFSMKEAAMALETLTAAIDSALLASSGAAVQPPAAKIVRRDVPIEDTVPMQGARHYKVPLPNKPVNVTVSLMPIQGPMPALWASTSNERPQARDHDVKGRDGKLTYQHVVNDENEAVMPAWRELYLTAEGQGAEATYKILVSLANVKGAPQPKGARRGWQARLAELKRENAARENFEERVRAMQEERRAKQREFCGGVNIPERNMKAIADFAPEAKLQQIERRALQDCERQALVLSRRREHLLEEESRKQEWLFRREAAVMAQEEQELRRQQAEIDVKRRKAWLVRLAVVAFGIQWGEEFEKARSEREIVVRQLAAAGVIQRTLIRAIASGRRKALYRNVIRLRMSLAAYSRVTRLTVMTVSQPVVHRFLDSYAFHREVPTFGGVMRRFRGHVLLVQRRWREVKMIREAYISLFWPYWMQIHERVYKELAVRDAQVRQQKKAELESALGGIPAASAAAPRRRDKGRRPSMFVSAPGLPLQDPANVEVAPEDMPELPNYMIKMQLHDYIRQMQRSHQKRVQEWEEAKRKVQWKKDLVGFGVASDAVEGEAPSAVPLRGHKPRVVYVDEKELEGVVRQTIDDWRDGKFRDVAANRARIMRWHWRCWCLFTERSRRQAAKNAEPAAGERTSRLPGTQAKARKHAA